MVQRDCSPSSRPRALLICPIAPAPTGNGLAMRAAVTLQGLSRAYNLTTAVLPVSDPGADAASMGWAAEHSARAFFVPLPAPTDAARRWLADPSGRAVVAATQPLPNRARLACPDAVSRELAGETFDLVWVMRLYIAGTVLPYRGCGARLILDLDEDDAATLTAIADLHRQRGEADAAARTTAEADAYARLAKHTLGWFDHVATASDLESDALRRRHGLAAVTTVPNAVGTAIGAEEQRPGDGAPSVLFIGNLDYLPNLDAAERLATAILPALRRRCRGAELHIIGAGAGATRLAGHAGVQVHGFIPDLTPFYRRADLALVPLRAGGGSRLKILEAFAHGLPVAATPAAAAGLGIRDGDQLLIADDDAALVDAAGRILTDASLAGRLSANAARFVADHHDAETVAAAIADLAAGPDAN